VEHVIRRTRNPGILTPALPDQLEHVVDTRQDVVHENDRIKRLAFTVSQFVKGHHGSVSDLGQILDTMVERSSRPHRCPDDDPHSDNPSERVKDLQQRLGLVVGTVLVDGHKHVVVPQHPGRPEHGRKEIRNDVKRVVQVDGEKVLVLLGDEVPLLVFVPTGRSEPIIKGPLLHLTLLGVHGLGRMSIRNSSMSSQPKPTSAGRVGLVTDQRLISLVYLSGVQSLGIPRTFLGVMRRERGDELEHSITLCQVSRESGQMISLDVQNALPSIPLRKDSR
jgi:hypothetical protein